MRHTDAEQLRAEIAEMKKEKTEKQANYDVDDAYARELASKCKPLYKYVVAYTQLCIKAAEQMAQWATPEPPDVSLAYATPAGTYGTLSSAVSGTVDVNSRDDMIASAVNLLAQKLDGLAVEMDGKQVGKLVAPTVSREIKRETDNAIIGGGRRARI